MLCDYLFCTYIIYRKINLIACVKNKETTSITELKYNQLRTKIIDFFDWNFELIQTDLKKLKPHKRVKLYIDLVQGKLKIKNT